MAAAMGLTLIIAEHRVGNDLAWPAPWPTKAAGKATSVRYLRLPRLMEELGPGPRRTAASTKLMKRLRKTDPADP